MDGKFIGLLGNMQRELSRVGDRGEREVYAIKFQINGRINCL